MGNEHNYKVSIKWTGNKGKGTSDYQSYERSHTISVDNKVEISGSSDAPFRGDVSKHNPEDLLVASLSSCHMLWYLHFCADNGIIVTDYVDHANGTMTVPSNAKGHFVQVTLNPVVTVTEKSMIEKAIALHKEAHHSCFIANSVNFPVTIEPVCEISRH